MELDLEPRPLAARLLVVLLLFALIYYLAPNADPRTWKWVSPARSSAAVAWLALSGLFALYTSFSDSYTRTYGSLAGGIVLLLWLNYSAWAILFGAELNSELDRQADIHAAGGETPGRDQSRRGELSRPPADELLLTTRIVRRGCARSTRDAPAAERQRPADDSAECESR